MPEELKTLIPPPTKNRGVWIALGLTMAVVTLGGIWFWIGRDAQSPAAASPPRQVESTLHLEDFVLNLADLDARSYLRVGIDLGLNREIKRGEEIPVAKTRDAILEVLSQGRADDLLTAAGKARLKIELLRKLQERVPELSVEEVYFSEFLIQR